MTAYTWIGGTGDWKVAANWSPSGGPPGATDSATISATGAAYTVTINSADVSQSLTESSASATVDDTGSLTLSGTFTLSAGTFILGSGGTLRGGTTKIAGGTFACDGGTLGGVTYDGTLDLSGANASVYLASGTVVNNAAGTGAGTINDTGDGSTLYFDKTQTFNNATINVGSTSGGGSNLIERDTTGAGTVLTLGSGVTINESGNAEIGTGNHAGDGIVDQGNISQTARGGYLIITGNSFTNSGTITAASSGGILTIEPDTFTNSGTLTVSNGDAVDIQVTNFGNAATGVIAVDPDSTLDLAPGGSWSNQGSITLASGSSLYLGGSFAIGGLGTLTNSGGTVYIEGTFNNTGGTLIGTTALGQAVLYAGTIQGGAVTPSGLLLSSNGTLSGVTYDGTLDLSGEETSVHLAGGTVVNNAAGTGAGTINDTGFESYLYFDNTQTFNNATISLGSTPGYSVLEEYDLTGAGTVLTLGSGVTIDESGNAYIETGDHAGDGIVNQGNISQTASGGNLVIAGNSFTNDGTITAASSGGILTIDTTTFTDNGAIDISNGETVTIDSPASTTMIATNGTTTLVGNLFELNPASGGTGPLLELNGSVVTAGQFPAGWTPVGAEKTSSGYEVAWSVPGKNDYAVWNTDSNGDFTSGEAGVLPGEPPALWTINTNGVTSLVQVGNHYELEAVSSSAGPLIELYGSAVTAGQFPAGWTPVGAVQTASGYEVAWSVPGANEYVVWNTDSNGDYTSAATGVVSGTSLALEAAEAYFDEDFPGAGPPATPDTPVSTTVTATNGATTLEIDSTASNSQTVDFADLPSRGPSAVDLIDPNGFFGQIANFTSPPDAVDVSGDWIFLKFNENSAATLGTLTVQNVTSHADLSLKFVGDYATSDFKITPGMTTTTIAHS